MIVSSLILGRGKLVNSILVRHLSRLEDMDEDEEDIRRNESDPFLKTLESSPHLGHLVRRLVLITNQLEYEATANHIKILSKCPLLEDLKIHGYNIRLGRKLMRAVSQLSHLRFLSISRYGLDQWPTTRCLGNEEDWMRILTGLPDIEHAMVPWDTKDYSRSRALEDYCSSRGIDLIQHQSVY